MYGVLFLNRFYYNWNYGVQYESTYFLCVFRFFLLVSLLAPALVPIRVTLPRHHCTRSVFSFLLLIFVIMNTICGLLVSPACLVSTSLRLTMAVLICLTFLLYSSCVSRLLLSHYEPG